MNHSFEALRLLQYRRLASGYLLTMVADNVEVLLTEEGANLHVDFMPGPGDQGPHMAAIDAAMCVLFHASQRLSEDRCQVAEVRLQRPQPAEADLLRYKRFFRHAPKSLNDQIHPLVWHQTRGG